MFERKDHYYRRAKREGLASRAAYKLEEIQKKFGLIRKNDAVLEWGAAPGGWTGELAAFVGPKGLVVAVDRLPLKIVPPPQVRFLEQEFETVTDEILRQQLSGREKFDCIVSDLSPDLSGIEFRDACRSAEIGRFVWQSAQKFLRPKRNLLMKLFRGEETDRLINEVTPCFEEVRRFVPDATRKASREFYLVGIRSRKVDSVRQNQ